MYHYDSQQLPFQTSIVLSATLRDTRKKKLLSNGGIPASPYIFSARKGKSKHIYSPVIVTGW
jgi:hypothetical protein